MTTPKLQMSARRQFGLSNKARLNQPLFDAVLASMPGCEVCRDIQKDIEVVAGGAEFVEAASFPGRTVSTLDAHFRFHWKDEYQLI